MTATVAEKAAAILTQGRLTITLLVADRIYARCTGSGGTAYDIAHDLGGWSCSCPARRECSHIAALKIVTLANPRRSA